MDPVTALAAASAIWASVKGAVAAGQEVQDVLGQLGAWFQQAGEVYEYINYCEGKPSVYHIAKPKIKSETTEAFEIYSAKVQLRQMEAEIRHEFLYGGLCHLGMDGYKEFLQIRHDLRVRRAQQALAQRREQDLYWEDFKFYAKFSVVMGISVGLLIWMISL